MAGKAWCCGGGSGGGGGLTSITTADTPTVDLEGDGSAGAPLTATVLRSADAGNVLATGTDGGLFVPTPTDTTTLLPVVGGAPAPVGTARSVDIDITESPADTWNVGARLSPVWAQGQPTFLGVVNNVEGKITELIVPEAGVYLMEVAVEGIANVTSMVASADRWVIGSLKVDGVTQRTGYAVVNRFALSGGIIGSRAATSTITFTWRMQLNAGQAIQAWALPSFDAANANDGFGAIGTVGYQKISD